MALEESKATAGYAARPGYPISYSVIYPERLSRRKAAQRAVGALLGWIVPAGLGYVSAVFYLGLWIIVGSLIAFGVVSVPQVLAIRIRAKGLPRFLDEDGATLERYAGRALA